MDSLIIFFFELLRWTIQIAIGLFGGRIYGIYYKLPEGGRVSVAVYRGSRLIRQTIRQRDAKRGWNFHFWYGEDEDGLRTGGGKFTWKLLFVPEAMTASYRNSLCSTIPEPTSGVDSGPDGSWWKTGLGDIIGPRSIALDKDGGSVFPYTIFIGAGSSEVAQNGVKVEKDNEEWKAVWSVPNPVQAEQHYERDYEDSNPLKRKVSGQYMGRWALAVFKNNLFHLQQNGYIGAHPKSQGHAKQKYIFRRRRENLEDNWGDKQLIESNASESPADIFIGTGWDALKDICSRDDAFRAASTWDMKYRTEKDHLVEMNDGTPLFLMDMTAGEIDLGQEKKDVVVFAVDYHKRENNTHVGKVRYFEIPTEENSDHYAIDPFIVKEFNVIKPRGVTIDQNGHVLVISEDKVYRLNASDNSQTEVISGLNMPYRLDQNGNDLYISEMGTHLVKHFQQQGSSYIHAATYGQPGGWEFGEEFNTVNLGFRDVVDIAAFQGGFYVVEHCAPRRIAKFNVANGKHELEKEFYGGTMWIPGISPNPRNVKDVWVTATPHELIHYNLDDEMQGNNTFSVYRFTTFHEGDSTAEHPLRLGGKGLLPCEHGEMYWQVRYRGLQKYLVRRNRLEVLEIIERATAIGIDPRDGSVSNPIFKTELKLIVLGNPNNSLIGGSYLHMRDGDGVTAGLPANHLWSLQAPSGVDYFHFTTGIDGVAENEKEIMRIRSTDDPGVHYNLNYANVNMPNPTLGWHPYSPSIITKEPISLNGKSMFAQRRPGAPLYMVINAVEQNDAESFQYSYLHKIAEEPDGSNLLRRKTIEWRLQPNALRNKTIKPPLGHVYAFRTNVGVIQEPATEKEIVVATDYDGGYDGLKPAMLYAWDEDGLYVGDLFEKCEDGPMWKYVHSSDNLSGAIWQKKRSDGRPTDEVYYFAGAENEVRIYMLSGWWGWLRDDGKVYG